jgi:DNA-binding response OmpR family regulator
MENYDFEIDHVISVKEAIEQVYRYNFDIYLLDINLQDSLNGMELLTKLRNFGDNKPALFLTSDSSSTKAIECFGIGCDDYIRKQCDMAEIAERIKLSIKKNYSQKSSIFKLQNGFEYNISSRELQKDGAKVELAQKELILLELLIKKAGVTVSWDEITATLWAPSDEISFASVRVYVNILKKILGKDAIQNSKGIGYKLVV